MKESHQGSVVVATKAVLKTVGRIHLTLGVMVVLMGITSVGRTRGLLLTSMGLSLSLGLRLDLRLTALSSFTLSASFDSECTIAGVISGGILVFLLVLVALLAVIAVMAGSTTLQRGELFGNPFREAASAGRTGGGVGVGAV